MSENNRSAGINRVFLYFMVLLVVSFVFQEWTYASFPGILWIRWAGKAITSGILLMLYFYGLVSRERRGNLGGSIRPSFGNGWLSRGIILPFLMIVFYSAADMLILTRIVTGMLLFAAGHCCLILLLLQKKHRGAGVAAIGSAVLVIVIAGIAFKVLPSRLDFLIPGGALYSFLLLYAVILSFRNGGNVRWGTLFFLLSDLLLVRNFLTGLTLPRHVLAAAFYYIAVTFLVMPSFIPSQDLQGLFSSHDL